MESYIDEIVYDPSLFDYDDDDEPLKGEDLPPLDDSDYYDELD